MTRTSSRGGLGAGASNATEKTGNRPDSVSVSPEAYAKMKQLIEEEAKNMAAAKKFAEKLATMQAGEFGGVTAGERCEFVVDGETIDLTQKLKELSESDFGAFKKALEDLKSGDAERFVEALATLTGKEADRIRVSLRDMQTEETDLFCSKLSELIECEPEELMAALKNLTNWQSNVQEDEFAFMPEEVTVEEGYGSENQPASGSPA